MAKLIIHTERTKRGMFDPHGPVVIDSNALMVRIWVVLAVGVLFGMALAG
jgi:hypothetical protein